MKPIRGINQDVQPIDQPENSIFYSRNSIRYVKLGSWSNEPGFIVSSVAIPYTHMGTIAMSDGAIIFSTDNINSAIGIYNEKLDTYTPVLDRTDLGFNLANRITGQYKRNYKGDIICVFTDRVLSAKHINLTIATNTQDLSDFLLFPISSVPDIELLSVDESGGVVKSGVHYVSIQYETLDGTLSNWSEPSSPVFITDDNIAVGTGAYDGVAANTTTAKKIQYTISNIDTSYDKLNIAIISKINGITIAKTLPQIDISGDITKTISYLGNETTEDIDFLTIIASTSNYNVVGTFAQLNDILYAGNLSSTDLIRFQKYANNIQINYTSKITKANELTDTVVGTNITEYASHRLNTTPRGFLHDEVYAMYICLILNNGSRSPSFLIPGREPRITERDPSGLAATQAFPNAPKKFQVEDTSSFISYNPTLELGKGDMSYWENQTETFPNNDEFNGTIDSNGNPIIGGRDLRGLPVRHHKFPSIAVCKDRHYPTNNNYGKGELDILGIDVSNVIIPDDIKLKIQGYEIYYAKREIENATIVGQSLVQLTSYQRIASVNNYQRSWTTGGNWNVDDNDIGSVAGSDGMFLSHDYIRLYSFDLLNNKPEIGPTHISQQLKLRANTLSFIPDPNQNWWGYILDYVNLASSSDSAADDQKLRTVSEFRYVPHGAIVAGSNAYNIGAEECLHMRMGNPLNINESLLVVDVQSGYADTLTFEETFLSNLCQLRDNVYNTFKAQTLVSTGAIQLDKDSTTLENIYGGDTYVSMHSYVTTAPRNPIDSILGDYNRFVHRFVCESVSNIGLRHETSADSSKYWPKTTGVNLFNVSSGNTQVNNWGYNKDYSSVLDLVAAFPNDVEDEKVEKYPYRVISSNPSKPEDKDNVSWRTFLTSNYYDSVQNKGEIINLATLGSDKLIIHHRNSMFVTKSTTRLLSDSIEVTLGSGDIFGVKPEEPMPAVHGYLGTQHQLACLETKYGYLSIDAENGNIYIYNGGTKAASLTDGLRNFLAEALPLVDEEDDNPYTGNGISVAWDDEFERIIIGVKNTVGATNKSFTISYDWESKSWSAFHDYTPDYIFNTRTRLHSSKKQLGLSKLFEHNFGPRGVYYNAIDATPVPYPSYVDVVFRGPKENPKDPSSKTLSLILQSINWITEAINGNSTTYNETFDYVTVRTIHKCSGRVELTNGISILPDHNNRNIQGGWQFNAFRNLVINPDEPIVNDIYNNYSVISANINENKAWFDKSRFEGKFFIIRLEYSNSLGKILYLHEINALARLSHR